ncbi:MAG TPA: sigma-70 family RNA polymerase sigma factor [Polyangiales bacterium]|nr:sigma-70 family RNA polymerase sigma factor [Polyangiales bacterium]
MDSHESDALDQLYRAHAPSVYRRARALLGDEADAQRVVSDVFGQLHAEPRRFVRRRGLCRQLYAMTTRACINRLRSRKLQARPAADGGTDERSAALCALLDALPEPLSQLAVYYYFDELTQEEVTELLGCSQRSIRGLLAQLEHSTRRAELQR